MTPLQLSHSMLISTPPAIVWRVTTDVALWPDWSPTITAVSGRGGGALFQGGRYDLKQPFQRRRPWVVLQCAEPHFLRLRTVEGDMTALHELSEMEDRTCNMLSLRVSGLLGRFAQPLLSPALRKENAALKMRCESLVTGNVDPSALRKRPLDYPMMRESR